jgi:peptide deformylase
MSLALKSQGDGIALAAPQIGYPLRIFIISGKILNSDLATKDLVFINPKISKLSRKKEWLSEGCLSVRPFYGKTFRSSKATVTAYDQKGKKINRGASGLLAQIFQHETDHLNGILFIDHAKDIREEKIHNVQD